MIDTNGREWKAQLKVDGIRGILHAEWTGDGHDITIFSRAKNDITESIPEINELAFPKGKYIFDGEIIAENSSYSDTSKRIGRSAENVERDVEMEYAVFDCVVYQGDDISGWEYEDRFDTVSKVVDLVDDGRLWSPKLWYDYDKALDMVAREGAEGLILKRMDSPYEFGKRSDKWCKMKMDAETVDVVATVKKAARSAQWR